MGRWRNTAATHAGVGRCSGAANQTLFQPRSFMSEPTTVTNEDVIARGGEYYRRMRYLVAVILMAAGVWFAYDGWVGWPRINAKIAGIKQDINQQDEHTEIDQKRRA